jgi:hypothetical protein
MSHSGQNRPFSKISVRSGLQSKPDLTADILDGRLGAIGLNRSRGRALRQGASAEL